MKKVNKFILPIIVYIILILVASLNLLFTSKVEGIFKLIRDLTIQEGGYYNYPTTYIVIYIFSILNIVTCITSLILHFISFKHKHIIQSILLYANIASFIVSIIMISITHFNYYDYYNFDISDLLYERYNSEMILLECELLGKIFAWLLLQSIISVICSVIITKYSANNQDNSPSSHDDKSSVKTQMLKEIEEMKAQLELQELKNEYMELYKKVNIDKEK